MRAAVLPVALLLLAGCSGAHTRLAVSPDGRAVLRDVYDGRLDRSWSCGSLRAAEHRLPQDGGPTYSELPQLIRDAEARACDRAVRGLHPGTSKQQVRAALGPPDSAPRCWHYRWAALRDTSDGARICFAGARASLVQVAVHG